MAGDYEDVYDIEEMDDGELRDLILQKLEEEAAVDLERLEIRVADGNVTLEGRVGTERELQQIEQVVSDMLGISDAHNDVVVDELVRAERADAADEAAAEDAAADAPLGEGGHRTSDTADHMLADTEHDQFGTSNPQEATERGFSYNPPQRPEQEGTRSEERH
jgi:hypothetical protein